MELINLTKFQDLFDSDGLDELTFSEAGIEVKPSSGTSNRQMMFAQLACLEFPCTEQQLYDWAQGLDDHESFYVKLTRYCLIEPPKDFKKKVHTINLLRGLHCVNNLKAVSFHIRPDKHHHFVERLHKDFKEKWKNDNERRREWGFELGFKPDNIEAPHNWAHWLTLSGWTREQAARLICDSNPRQDGLYEALSMLLDRMPSIETQAPFNWLKWFDANGFLSCAPKRILEWYAEEKMTKPVMDDGADNHVEPESTIPNERELTRWLRETWINESKPGGTAFFNSLKKYAGKDGSPITQHYTAGKNAGFDWRTSSGTTGTTPKKTVLNKVGIFKNTP